jgi:CheY-like chemotaxis protein
MDTATADILLVEGDPSDVELTLYTLRRNNVTDNVSIRVARDGAEALEFIFCTGAHAGRDAPNNPKVVLLDLRLPKVNGLEVLERVRGDSRTRGIPVVVLTASAEGPDVARARELGVSGCIVKPVDLTQFASAMRDLGLHWMLGNAIPDK